MGWSGGSGLAYQVWDAVKAHIPKYAKPKVARDIISAFEQQDADTMQEAEELWDAAYIRCKCYDPATWECNNNCTKCDGLGWVDRK
jgi:hypothetical protein